MAPRKKFYSDKQIEEIKQQAMAFWENSTNRAAGFFKRVNDYERLSEVKLPLDLEAEFKKHPDRSALVPPDIHNNLKSINAQIQDLLFSSRPYATVSHPGEPLLRDESVDKVESKLSAIIDQSKFRRESNKINQQALACGISCCFTEWYKEWRRVPVINPLTNEPATKNGQILYEEKLGAAYPRARGIDIRRVRIDDKAESAEDIRIVGYHAKTNISDLIIHNQNPMSFINFDVKALEKTIFPREKYYEYLLEQTPMKGRESKTSYGDVPVEIIEIRGIFRLDENYVDLIVKIANRNIVIEARPNDLRVHGWETFDFACVQSKLAGLFNMGLIEPTEDIFIELFVKRNQSLDASNRQTYDMYIGDSQAMADMPDQIEYVGGKIVKVNALAAGALNVQSIFQPIPHFSNPIDTFNQAAKLENQCQQTMGRNDYVQGNDPSRKETATAVASLEAAGFRDIKDLVGNLCDSYIFPVWQKFIIYYNQFGVKGQEQIMTQDGRKLMLNPGDLDFPFDLTVDISAALDRPNAVRRVIESLPFAINNPNIDQEILWKNWAFFTQQPNADRLVPPSSLKTAIVERENLALRQGIMVPVHPMDDHALHLQIHQSRAQQDSNDESFDLTDKGVSAYSYHVSEHQKYIEKANNPFGVNTPKTSDGANNGQMIGGNNAGIPQIEMAGTTPG